MSKPSKSQNSEKSSSSRGSICPPTARSPTLLTASVLTDPRQISTARSNSVNTARGATASEFEPVSGLSDTSAGSGRANSTNISEPKTAKSPTSPELLMNDLRRGTLFGRQTKSQKTSEEPQSVTNITFSNNTSTRMSTASQPTNLDTALSAETSSVKTGKMPPRNSRLTSTSQSSITTAPSSSGASLLSSVQTADQIDSSTKSTKSVQSKSATTARTGKSRLNKSAISSSGPSQSRKRKASKKANFNQQSTKSMKSAKVKKAATKPANVSIREKSEKPSQAKKQTEEKITSSRRHKELSAKIKAGTLQPNHIKATKMRFDECEKSTKSADGKSGVVKLGDKQKEESVYFPQPVNSQKTFATKNNKNKSMSRKGGPPPSYNWPGNGRCTRNMEARAPVSTTPLPDTSVYNVADLPPAQRGLGTASSAPAAPPPKSLFGVKKPTITAEQAAKIASGQSKPLGNKIVILGQTPDGKTTVQMTIDMQIVAGVGLGASGEPVELKPKKVVVAGNEYPVDSKRSG
uniref:Uncharacterized protein n=1 Tax=Caenorhabditis japonica TaxID=281687 RepID=A0A8R1DY28_CAEJA